MEYFIIAAVALLASGLTLFSGFGLGTILMPVFALFFPVDLAIAMTAIVHLLNNLFKFILLGKYANRKVILRFGIPAIFAAFIGAKLLLWVTGLSPLFSYEIAGRVFYMEPVKLLIAVLMIVFAFLEIIPKFEQLSISEKFLPAGGFLSGLFGGISGHQGALRSAFLLKCGLSKESFIATGVVIACIVDLSRLFVYSSRFAMEFTGSHFYLLITAVAAAFSGAYLGNKYIKKVTMKFIRILVAVLLFLIALLLGSGVI